MHANVAWNNLRRTLKLLFQSRFLIERDNSTNVCTIIFNIRIVHILHTGCGMLQRHAFLSTMQEEKRSLILIKFLFALKNGLHSSEANRLSLILAMPHQWSTGMHHAKHAPVEGKWRTPKTVFVFVVSHDGNYQCLWRDRTQSCSACFEGEFSWYETSSPFPSVPASPLIIDSAILTRNHLYQYSLFSIAHSYICIINK